MGDGSDGGSTRLAEELRAHEEAAQEAGVTMCVDVVDGQTFYGYFGVYDPAPPRLSLWARVRVYISAWWDKRACYHRGHQWQLAGDWKPGPDGLPFDHYIGHFYEFASLPGGIRIHCMRCGQHSYGRFRRLLGYDAWLHGGTAPEWELVANPTYYTWNEGEPVTGGPTQEEIKAVLG